jgi:hypothetical protein
MSFQVQRIEVGPARIFLGTTNPASGAPPTFVSHTAGVPNDGTEVGLTNGDTVLEVTSQKTEITAEQYYAPVAVFLTMQSCKVTFTAQEATVIALRAALDNIGQFSDGTKDAFYFGSGSGAFSCLTQSVFLSARRRDDPSKYIIALIYKAYSSKPLTFPFSRTKPSNYPVELAGLADTARTAGDAVGQFYREV